MSEKPNSKNNQNNLSKKQKSAVATPQVQRKRQQYKCKKSGKSKQGHRESGCPPYDKKICLAGWTI